MPGLPPLTELRAFEAAARHRSFQQAAAELAVSPSAISHQVRLLERNLGSPLFRRGRRPIELTDAGAKLLPVISRGLALFKSGVESVRSRTGPLIVTTTNAFAARWLIPRLPEWRASYPGYSLEVIGTDDVVDLNAGQAQVAVRYTRTLPAGCTGLKLFEDHHWPAAVPGLLPPAKSLGEALHGQTLIHAQWQGDDPPTWERWLETARTRGEEVPSWEEMSHVRFREEAHAIDAVIAGQGVGICSDILVAREFGLNALLKLSDFSLRGYSFFLVYPDQAERSPQLTAFIGWLSRAVETH